jgi:flagellar hook-length control protein FliK
MNVNNISHLNTASGPAAVLSCTTSASAAPQAAAEQPSFASLLSRSQAPVAERKAEDATPDAEPTGELDATDTQSQSTATAADDAAAGSAARRRTPTDEEAADAAKDPALADWLAGLNLQALAPATTPEPPATPEPKAADEDGGAAPVGEADTTLARNAAAATLALGASAAAAAGGASPDPAVLPAAARATHERGGPDALLRGKPADAPGTTTALNARSAAENSAHDGDPGTGLGGNRDTSAWTPVASASLVAATADAPTFMPTALQTLASPQPGQSAALPLAVALPTPLYAPEFPHALGAQLTLLAQGGVEHAELHLNPAEMGPVSVQIVVDGTQARIEFGADTAATRQAIESGLPALAGALREAGLTLTGGGVSQHSRSRQDSDGQHQAHTASSRGDDNSAVPDNSIAATPLRRSVRAGGIDAYA